MRGDILARGQPNLHLVCASICVTRAALDARFFDFTTKKYKETPVDQQTEVLSAMGDVAVTTEKRAFSTSFSDLRMA